MTSDIAYIRDMELSFVFVEATTAKITQSLETEISNNRKFFSFKTTFIWTSSIHKIK